MAETLILKNADLLTMDDSAKVRRGDLWIADGKIQKIVWAEMADESETNVVKAAADESELNAEKAADAELIDCTGCTIMPGLIDSHVHFDESYMGDFFIASGITSVRNMRGFEGHARWRDEILAGKRRGPYIYSSGPLYDGEDPTIPHNDNVIISTPEDVEEGIRYTKKYNFLWVKTYPSIEPDLYRYLMTR